MRTSSSRSYRVPCLVMASDQADISALFPEPNLPEDPVEASDDLSHFILESIKLDEKAIKLSPDEVAWADSCLVFSELSDNDWGEMRDALLVALGKSVISPCDTPGEEHEEGIQESGGGEPVSVLAEEPSPPRDVQMEQNPDDKDNAEVCKEAIHALIGAEERGIHINNAATDADADEVVASEVHDDTESKDSIFTVWDLKTSYEDEEDELIKELGKLMGGNILESSSISSYDTSEYVHKAKIDELVADMSDLSLQQLDD